MLESNGVDPFTAHTTNPVPLVAHRSERSSLRDGGELWDLAPTVLDLLGITQPAAMTGARCSPDRRAPAPRRDLTGLPASVGAPCSSRGPVPHVAGRFTSCGGVASRWHLPSWICEGGRIGWRAGTAFGRLRSGQARPKGVLMIGRMATYRFSGDAQDLGRRAEAGILPILQASPGFASYTVSVGDGEVLALQRLADPRRRGGSRRCRGRVGGRAHGGRARPDRRPLRRRAVQHHAQGSARWPPCHRLTILLQAHVCTVGDHEGRKARSAGLPGLERGGA